MKRTSPWPKLLLGLFFSLALGSALAAPLFVPLSATTRTVPLNGTANVYYLVINPTAATERYVLRPIKAIGAVKGLSTDCGPAFSLKKNQSCVLKLRVDGGVMRGIIQGGPNLCFKNAPNQCNQPSLASRLKLTRGPALTLRALTATKLSLTNAQKATVTYLLTNHKKQKVAFNMPAIQGIAHNARITGSIPSCGANFRLGFKRSCMLSLLADGSKIPAAISEGPKVCIKGTTTCFQPNPSQRLNITKDMPDIPKFRVGANVSGLSGTLVLRNNGSNHLNISSNGTVFFTDKVAKNNPYNVTVFSQPVQQTCSVTSGGGTIVAADVVVNVNCVNKAPSLVSIAITPTDASIAKGLTQQYTATGTYTDGSTAVITDGVTWGSSDTGIATISNDSGSKGLATAVSVGDANISASLSGITSNTSNTNLTIGNATLVSIAITPTDASIAKGLTQQYTATGTYTDGSTAVITDGVTWESSDTGIATISNDSGSKGLATAVSVGDANISASLSGITSNTSNTNLTVTIPTHNVNVTVSIPTGTVIIQNGSEQYTMSSSGTYAFSVEEGAIYNVTATDAPSNQTCAVTNGSGTMGTSDVAVQVTCTINLRTIKANVDGVTGTLVLQNNGTDDLTITSGGLYSFSTQAEEGSNYVVTVSASPEHQNCAVTDGSGTVPASDVTVDVNCTTNLPVLQSIEVTPSNATVATGQSQQYTATGIYNYGANQDLTSSVTWSSGTPSVATISNSGMANAIAAGTTNITATLDTISGSTSLTVNNPASLSVSGSPLLMTLDFSMQGGSAFLGSANLLITNNSTTLTATYVQAALPGGWSDVLQDPSDCTSLLPGTTCTLKFTLTTNTIHAAEVVQISGTNTNSVSATLGVNRPWVTNGRVNAVLPDPAHNAIYIGGSFTYVGPNTGNGVPIDFISGAALTSFPRVNGTINAAIPDGVGGWYIGGTFTRVGGITRNRIAHILSDYTVDPNFNPNANGIVYALALNGSTVYAGGDFSGTNSIGGQTRNRIAALCITANCDGNNTAAGNATPWDPNADNTVRALVINGSTVYAGGEFLTIGGQSRNRIAAPDASTGSAIPTWNPNADSPVNALAINGSGSIVYAGGDFGNIGGQTRNRLAALDASPGSTGSAILIWNPNADNRVNALAINGSIVYAGGDFTNIGDQTRNYIAAIDTITGSAVPTWNPNADGHVLALAINASTNTVYAGGNFTNIGGQTRNRLAALDASPGSTGQATTWNPNADAPVLALAINGSANTVYAGGFFTIIGNRTRNYIAALDANQGLPRAWDPNANGPVYALAINGSTVYAGGNFTNIGSLNRNRLAALDVNTDSPTTWNPNANGPVYALAINANSVYAGGNFTTIGELPRNNIAALCITANCDNNNTAAGSATTWGPDASNTVYALAINGSTVYAGGSFTSIKLESCQGIAIIPSP